jgi:hypothetical protein
MTDLLTRPPGSDPLLAALDTFNESPESTALFEVDDREFASESVMPRQKPKSRFKLIDPNRTPFVWTSLVVFATILAASIVWSFTAIVEMSDWMAPNEHFRWLPAVFIDLAIIGYTFTLAQFKARGAAGRRKLWMTRTGLLVSTGFSVVANATHTIDHWNGDISTYQAIIGVTFSASIPILALMATEEIVRLAFVDPDEELAAAKNRKTK